MLKITRLKYAITALFIFFFNLLSFSQDRMFAYTYQTNVLNKGDFDLEFQNTLSTGKSGAYSPYVFGRHLDQRLEYEIGLGKNIQTSFYLNSELFNYADTSSTSLNQEMKISFSNEWKWKLSDPVANGIGFALYEELEFGGNNFESETKLIFDKRWQKDLVAFNIVYKYEIEKEISRINNVTKGTWVSNSPVELYFAYMHFYKQQFGMGMELRDNNLITHDEDWKNSVIFGGPAFHASAGRFFVNLSVLPQLINLHKTASAPGNLDLNNFGKIESRIIIGYSL